MWFWQNFRKFFPFPTQLKGGSVKTTATPHILHYGLNIQYTKYSIGKLYIRAVLGNFLQGKASPDWTSPTRAFSSNCPRSYVRKTDLVTSTVLVLHIKNMAIFKKNGQNYYIFFLWSHNFSQKSWPGLSLNGMVRGWNQLKVGIYWSVFSVHHSTQGLSILL